MARYTKMKNRNLYQTKVRVDGKSKTIYAKTIKELEEKKYQAKNIHKSDYANFKELSDEWAKMKESEIALHTMNSYKIIIKKHLYPILSMKVEDIKLKHVQSIVNNMFLSGYSKSMIKHTLLVYSMIIKYGIMNGCELINYRDFAKINSNAPKKKIEAISKIQEEKIIVKNTKTSVFDFYAFLLLYTGLRKGEALALQWKHIDLDSKTIQVRQAITFEHNQPIIKKPKTDAGIRDVPIIDKLLPYLKELKSDNPNSFVFGDKKPLTKKTVEYRWNNYCKQNELNIKQHQLRHTFATYLYYAGVGLKEAQYIMGHSNINITLDIYTSLDDKHKENSRKKLNEFFD